MLRLAGSCHCGNITFTLDWRPQPTQITARECGCSFCMRHGCAWTACPQGSLRIVRRDARCISLYEFGTRTAQFHVCAQCGVVTIATSRIDGRSYAVVNANAFDNLPAGMLQRAVASFDDESESARLARRQRNWIASVAWVDAADDTGG